jgi:cytochrome c oxidase subunit 4
MTAAAHAHTPAELIAEESKRYHAFVNLALFLSVFTGLEIVIIFTPFPSWFLLTVLISLSIIKFFCVIFWFMHLIYDAPLLTILFLVGMVLAAGTMVALLQIMSPADITADFKNGADTDPSSAVAR